MSNRTEGESLPFDEKIIVLSNEIVKDTHKKEHSTLLVIKMIKNSSKVYQRKTIEETLVSELTSCRAESLNIQAESNPSHLNLHWVQKNPGVLLFMK